jgi:dihydropteroate synthase
MHKKGDPATMQRDPHYDDVVVEVLTFLENRMKAVVEAGIARDRIVLDPGFGFGKTLQHNMTLLRNLERFKSLGAPILAGWSRKSSLGKITGRPVEERLPASLAMALLSLQHGATILRVHDVKETKDVVEVWKAFKG